MNEELRTRIIAAFPKWNEESDSFVPEGITAEDFDALRSSIFDSRPEFLPHYLGVIMFDLLENHPPSFMGEESFTSFLLFLNGAKLLLKESQFNAISEEQASCVAEFLACAHEWDCSVIHRGEIEEAERYWRTRG